MIALSPRSLIFGAALGVLAGVSLAGTGVVEASARTGVPAIEKAILNDDDGSDVAGAAVDLADAQEWLEELEGGNFANIFVIEADGVSMRCGEVAANSACKPLNAADKAAAIAEAREAVDIAVAAVEDAEKQFAADQPESGLENASFTP